MQAVLFVYLILHTETNEKVLVYHSVGYGNAVFWAKKLKKFKMILEVEEIYQNVQNLGFIKNKREYRDFRLADGYIFPTKLLNDLINVEHKPYAVIHGTYHVEPKRNVSFQDNKIHVVYAGTFDSKKGGAAAAISAAKWLPENYHVHILGFGSEQEIQKIKDLVLETVPQTKAAISYDGLLAGEEYIQFIQKCHIGLSTQNPDASFNDTSFPSKILSYMANGLRVVTVRIPAIETSAIGKDVYYYEEQTPEKIAEAILKIDFHDAYDGRKKIAVLDQQFCGDLKEIILK
ncbi:glycosyltransferase [Ructibacterium gallinarum]|uniref:Glycosyltransferase n=1 Tax=Ructibacterium gallinarum TaxID=2779355 RepID=A0A9D5LZF7_9FIRM|nr:glycosyltransferase [Ructibacterium gallinarum]MBE5039336.1 glycosyltransferase [Ructibacterium gallinarum]